MGSLKCNSFFGGRVTLYRIEAVCRNSVKGKEQKIHPSFGARYATGSRKLVPFRQLSRNPSKLAPSRKSLTRLRSKPRLGPPLGSDLGKSLRRESYPGQKLAALLGDFRRLEVSVRVGLSPNNNSSANRPRATFENHPFRSRMGTDWRISTIFWKISSGSAIRPAPTMPQLR